MQSPTEPGRPRDGSYSPSNSNQPSNAGPGSYPAGHPTYPNQPPPYPAQGPTYPNQPPPYPAQGPTYPNQPPPYPVYPQPGMVPAKKRSNRLPLIIGIVVGVIALFLIVGVIVAIIPAGPTAISKAVMAKDVQNNSAVNETTVFATSDPKVHCVVNLDNPKTTTTVKGIYYVVSAGTIQNQKIGEFEVTTAGRENLVDLFLTPRSTFPVGSYKVEVYLDGTLNRTLEFTIQ